MRLTVRSPGGARTTVRVPADVPIGQLAPALGQAVSVANVTDLDDTAGRRLPARATLADAGLAPEATVVVVPPGITPATTVGAPIGEPPTAEAETAGAPVGSARPGPDAAPRASGGAATASPAPTVPVPAPAPVRHGRPGPILAAVAVLAAVAAVAFVLGGVVLGGTGSPGPGRSSEDAASAWLRAAPYRGTRVPGLPSDLQRHGGLVGAHLQPLGQWQHGDHAGELFAVTLGSSTFGLAVVTTGGALAFPPTPAPLPPVVGTGVPAPPAHLSPAGAVLPDPVQRWVAATFGPNGSAATALGLGLGGAVTAVGSWAPQAGGTAYRVRVPLTSLAPGTPGGQIAAAYQLLARRLASDTAANDAAQATSRQTQVTAQAATAASAAANPPNPALTAQAAAATAAAATAQQQAQAASAAVAADQAALASAPKPARSAATAVATYDVWTRARSVVGWAPAGYRAQG